MFNIYFYHYSFYDQILHTFYLTMLNTLQTKNWTLYNFKAHKISLGSFVFVHALMSVSDVHLLCAMLCHDHVIICGFLRF